jgi:DNA-3-methyladenine glycosylase I
MRVLKATPHFHLDFVHERLAIANLNLYLPRPAEERPEFSRPPANKGRLVFALKMVPAPARPFQLRHGLRAIGRSRLPQRPLLDQDNIPIASMAAGFSDRFSRCSLSRHPSNLRSQAGWERLSGGKMLSLQAVICCSATPAITHALRVPRCPWATTEPSIAYHDEEWGVPLHDDRKLFEFLILEGAQAGLSWITILKKRENYRKAFDGFRAEKIARYGARDVKRLLADAGIVRNRLKIAAAITNATAFLESCAEMGSFDAYLWSFVGGTPKQNRWRRMSDVPARTAESDAMSRDLLKRGFKFVGSTICYALMQATGMVNDHLVTCPRYAELKHARRSK